MLVFINTINHKVISLLAQVQKQPPKKLLGHQRLLPLILEKSWGTPDVWPCTPSPVPLCWVTVKGMAVISLIVNGSACNTDSTPNFPPSYPN